jgi:hypothetical protein
MEQLTAKITNFGCEHCGYYQDFNSLDEPERHARICPNVPAGVCPACHFGHNDDRVVRTTQLSQVVDLSQVSTVTIASDEELESKTEVEVDQSGDVVMEQTCERETLGIVDGKPAMVIEPIAEPKQRSLTTKELKDLKAQRK